MRDGEGGVGVPEPTNLGISRCQVEAGVLAPHTLMMTLPVTDVRSQFGARRLPPTSPPDHQPPPGQRHGVVQVVHVGRAVEHGGHQQLVGAVHEQALHAAARVRELLQLAAVGVPQPDGVVVGSSHPAAAEANPANLQCATIEIMIGTAVCMPTR